MDTIHFKTTARLRSEICQRLSECGAYHDKVNDWKFTTKLKPGTDGAVKKTTTCFQKNSGLTLGWDGETLDVKVSLPGLFHGVNSICLKYNEVNLALKKVWEKLDMVCECPSQSGNLTRLDFAIQIECDVRTILACYRGASTPLIQNTADYYMEGSRKKGTGLQWVGSDITITFYDKGIERNATTRGKGRVEQGKVLRIEVSLKNKDTIERFFAATVLNACLVPDYFIAWRVFRKIIASLQPTFDIDWGGFSFSKLFAHLEILGTRLPNGKTPLEARCEMLHPDNARKLRKEVSGIVPILAQLSLRNRLPLNVPPSMVDISFLGKLCSVPQNFYLQLED